MFVQSVLRVYLSARNDCVNFSDSKITFSGTNLRTMRLIITVGYEVSVLLCVFFSLVSLFPILSLEFALHLSRLSSL